MSQSFKYKNNMYLDTKGIVHNQKVLADILYPVGSVYLSVNSTSPATLFGGTWTQIKDAYLLTVGSTYTTSKATGGSWTSGSTTLTVDQIPSHTHTHKNYNFMRDAGEQGKWGSPIYTTTGYYTAIPTAVTLNNTGGGKGHTHSLTPPFFTVYAWYRVS